MKTIKTIDIKKAPRKYTIFFDDFAGFNKTYFLQFPTTIFRIRMYCDDWYTLSSFICLFEINDIFCVPPLPNTSLYGDVCLKKYNNEHIARKTENRLIEECFHRFYSYYYNHYRHNYYTNLWKIPVKTNQAILDYWEKHDIFQIPLIPIKQKFL